MPSVLPKERPVPESSTYGALTLLYYLSSVEVSLIQSGGGKTRLSSLLFLGKHAFDHASIEGPFEIVAENGD